MTKLGLAGHNPKNSGAFRQLAAQSHQHKKVAEAHLGAARSFGAKKD